MIKLHDPSETQSKAKPKTAAGKRWTIVARGKNNKGLRFLIEAGNFVQAMSSGARLCKERGVIFVGAFTGHMKALEHIEVN